MMLEWTWTFRGLVSFRYVYPAAARMTEQAAADLLNNRSLQSPTTCPSLSFTALQKICASNFKGMLLNTYFFKCCK